MTVYIGKSETLAVVILPENANDNRVVFSSNDESILTVDANGKITAVSKGTATVRVTLVDGGLFAECSVEVLCGHDSLGEWQFDDDKHWRECSVCGEEVEAGEHSFGEWNIISMPTDTEDGVRERACDCGHTEQQHFIIVEEDTSGKTTQPPQTYDPGEKDTAVSSGGFGCLSSVGSAYIIVIPFVCALGVALLRKKKDEKWI